MPVRYVKKRVVKSKAKKAKKGYSTRRRNYRVARLPRNPQYSTGGVISPYKIVNFCYTDSVAIGTVVPSKPEGYRFSLNSVFDPDSSGVGHQPLGHDEMAALYSKYKVLGARITARFFWLNTLSVGQAHRVGIYFDDDTTLPSSQFQISEKNHNRCSAILPPNAEAMRTVSCNWSGKKWFKENWITDGTTGVFGANPATMAYAFVWVNSMDGIASSDDVRIEVTLEYICKCYDPKELPVS